MSIPLIKYHSEDPGLNLFQTGLQRTLNPVLGNPLIDGVLLQKVVLAVGSNQVAHKLGRKLIGWYPTRVRAAATFYDTQDTNTLPEEFLTLVASAAVTIDLFVF